MRKTIMLLAGVIALFLATSLVLHAVYGPSFPFLSGEDGWVPDGQDGWRAHGHPSDPAPAQPSVNVPLLVNYLPIFLPGILLALFTLTPLRKRLDPKLGDVVNTDQPGPGDDHPPTAG